MPSQLVDEVRQLIRIREEAGRPVTALERTFIEAAIVPKRNTPDLVDELEAAIAYGRTVLLTEPGPGADPAQVRQIRQHATRRLIAAARAVLDHDPAREPADELDTPLPDLDPDRRLRADVDG